MDQSNPSACPDPNELNANARYSAAILGAKRKFESLSGIDTPKPRKTAESQTAGTQQRAIPTYHEGPLRAMQRRENDLVKSTRLPQTDFDFVLDTDDVPSPAASSSLPSGSNAVPALETSGYSFSDHFQVDAATIFEKEINQETRFAAPLQTTSSAGDLGSQGVAQGSERKRGTVASAPPDPSQEMEDAAQESGRGHVPPALQIEESTNTKGMAQESEQEHVSSDSSQIVDPTNNEGEAEESEEEFVATASAQFGVTDSTRDVDAEGNAFLDPLGAMSKTREFDTEGNGHEPDPLAAMDTMGDFGGGIQGSGGLVASELPNVIDSAGGLDNDEVADAANYHAEGTGTYSTALDPLQASGATRDFGSMDEIQGSEQDHGLAVSESPGELYEGANDSGRNSHVEGEGCTDSMPLDPSDSMGGFGTQGSEQEHGLVVSALPDPIALAGTFDDEGAKGSTRNSHVEGEGCADSTLHDPLQAMDTMRGVGGWSEIQGYEQEHGLAASESPGELYEEANDSGRNSHVEGEGCTDSMPLDPSDSTGGFRTQGSEQEHGLVVSVLPDPTALAGTFDDEGAKGSTRNSHVEGEGCADSTLHDPLQAMDTMRGVGGWSEVQGYEQDHGLAVSESPEELYEEANDSGRNSHVEGEGCTDSMPLDPSDSMGGFGTQGSEQEHGLIVSALPDPTALAGTFDDEGAKGSTRNSHVEGEGCADSTLHDPLQAMDTTRDVDGGIRGSESEHGLLPEPPDATDSAGRLDDKGANDSARNSHVDVDGRTDSMPLDPFLLSATLDDNTLQAADTMRDFGGGGGIQGSGHDHGLIPELDAMDSAGGLDETNYSTTSSHFEGEVGTDSMLLDSLQATDIVRDFNGEDTPRSRGEHDEATNFNARDSHSMSPIPHSHKGPYYRPGQRSPQPSVAGVENTLDFDDTSENSSEFEFQYDSSDSEDGLPLAKYRSPTTGPDEGESSKESGSSSVQRPCRRRSARLSLRKNSSDQDMEETRPEHADLSEESESGIGESSSSQHSVRFARPDDDLGEDCRAPLNKSGSSKGKARATDPPPKRRTRFVLPLNSEDEDRTPSSKKTKTPKKAKTPKKRKTPGTSKSSTAHSRDTSPSEQLSDTQDRTSKKRKIGKPASASHGSSSPSQPSRPQTSIPTSTPIDTSPPLSPTSHHASPTTHQADLGSIKALLATHHERLGEMISKSVSQSTETLQKAVIGERQRFETLLLERSSPATMPQRTRRPRSARIDYDSYANTDERNLLLLSISKHFLFMMQIKSLKQLHSIVLPTEKELEAYDNRDEGCISPLTENGPLRFDWNSNDQHPFNQEALDLLVQDFLRVVTTSGWYRDKKQDLEIPKDLLDVEYIFEAATQHFIYVKNRYKMKVKDPDANRDQLKKARQARSRRKTILHNNRVEVVRDEPELKRHDKLMSLVGRDATSSDESDGNSQECRYVVRPMWRSPQLTTFLRGLDAGIEQRKKPVLGQKRKSRSRRVFHKVDSPERVNEDSKAPHDLPRNCYDEDWYNSLPPCMQRRLRRRETAYNFDSGTGLVDDDDTILEDGS